MKSLSYLNKYFYKYRWRLLLGFIFLVITNLFGVQMPIVFGEAADGFKDSLSNEKTFDAVFSSALMFAGLYLLISVCKGLFLFAQRQTIIVASRLIEFDLKNEVYEKYQQLDYTFYKSQSTGDLMNRISEDVSQVRQYLGPGIMYTINLVVLFPLIIYQMLAISPKLTIYALAPLPVMAVMIYFVSSRMNALSKSVQKEQSHLSTIGQETFAGIRVIKAYIQERQTSERFNKSAEAYRRKNMRLVLVNALFMPTISLLIGISTLLSIYVGGLLLYENTDSMGKIIDQMGVTPGDILKVILFVNMLTWPFASVGWVTSIIQRASASQQRINEFLMITSSIKNPTDAENAPLESLRFEQVSFHYPNSDTEVLKDISLTIERGETIGIIGRTGSGKTTLAHLLLRQLDPTSGRITLNGKDLRSINLEQYRKESGVVPQDVFLFSDSIENNIAFGSNSEIYTHERIEKAAKDAHVLHNILSFENGFQTLLGERGVNLSGGQKQRVSIARALVREPKLLILDDCLSAVDTETEEIILRNLQALTSASGTTTVIVSHRISSLRNASKIIVIDHGRIVQSGNHAELIAQKGLYAEMYEKQLMEDSMKS